MPNRCFSCKVTYHSSKIIRDKKLKPFYSQGLCAQCYPRVIQEHTITCVECQLPFLKNQGMPFNLCPQCRISDALLQTSIILAALSRKTDSFADKSLVVSEWMATLKHFDAKCAYCQICAYECLEHFVPIKLGGGTCANNVVPSCLSCNALKKNLHPGMVKSIPQTDIDRVRSYLQSI